MGVTDPKDHENLVPSCPNCNRSITTNTNRPGGAGVHNGCVQHIVYLLVYLLYYFFLREGISALLIDRSMRSLVSQIGISLMHQGLTVVNTVDEMLECIDETSKIGFVPVGMASGSPSLETNRWNQRRMQKRVEA